MNIAARIKEARERKGLTKQALGRLMGMSHAAVGAWESGKNAVAQSNLPRLARLLGVTQSWLLDGTEGPDSMDKRIDSFGERDLPVYGGAVGGDGVVMLNRGDKIDQVSRPGILKGVRDAFAIVIYGDSMDPMYKRGDVAHIHPGRPPAPGRGILVEFHSGHAEIKEFVSQDKDSLRCRQYNPPQELRYDLADVKRLYRVVGTAEYG